MREREHLLLRLQKVLGAFKLLQQTQQAAWGAHTAIRDARHKASSSANDSGFGSLGGPTWRPDPGNSGEANGTPKSAAGEVEAIRVLQVARRSAVKVRTQAANQLHAVLVTAPDELRASFRNLSTTEIVDRAARMRPGRVDNPTAAAKVALVTLARRWLASYEAPALDPAIAEGLRDFVARKKASMPDAFT